MTDPRPRLATSDSTSDLTSDLTSDPSVGRSTDSSVADAAARSAGQRPDEGPSDRTTLTAVLDAYRASGFAGDFFAEEVAAEGTTEGDAAGVRAIVRCARCASVLDPRTVEMHSIRRLEGASDPADMVAVVATTCPVCGTDGTLVVSYGPMAAAVDADVFLAMRDRRCDDVLPPSTAPDESPEQLAPHDGRPASPHGH